MYFLCRMCWSPLYVRKHWCFVTLWMLPFQSVSWTEYFTSVFWLHNTVTHILPATNDIINFIPFHSHSYEALMTNPGWWHFKVPATKKMYSICRWISLRRHVRRWGGISVCKPWNKLYILRHHFYTDCALSSFYWVNLLMYNREIAVGRPQVLQVPRAWGPLH